jgi:hypothetical protein
MGVVLRIVSVLAVAIAAFLIYAVIHAVASDGGAKAGVAILYIVISGALTALAVACWRKAAGRNAAPAGPAGV